MLFSTVTFSFASLLKSIAKSCHLKFVHFFAAYGFYTFGFMSRNLSLHILPITKNSSQPANVAASEGKSDTTADDSGVFDEIDALDTSMTRALRPNPRMGCEDALPGTAPLASLANEFFG